MKGANTVDTHLLQRQLGKPMSCNQVPWSVGQHMPLLVAGHQYGLAELQPDIWEKNNRIRYKFRKACQGYVMHHTISIDRLARIIHFQAVPKAQGSSVPWRLAKVWKRVSLNQYSVLNKQTCNHFFLFSLYSTNTSKKRKCQPTWPSRPLRRPALLTSTQGNPAANNSVSWNNRKNGMPWYFYIPSLSLCPFTQTLSLPLAKPPLNTHSLPVLLQEIFPSRPDSIKPSIVSLSY